MPLKFPLLKEYSIDYDGLYTEFNSHKVFNNTLIQEKYLKTWFEILRKSDDITKSQMKDFGQKQLLLKEIMDAPEIFQIPVEYQTTKVFVHFRVSRIIEALEKVRDEANVQIQYFDTSDFVMENSNINWTKTNDRVVLKQEPIIMVPFMIGQYQLLVIDGNHRITEYINSDISRIAVYLFDKRALVYNNWFSTSFDKMMYIFHNELITIGEATAQAKLPPEKLIFETYPFSGNVICDI